LRITSVIMPAMLAAFGSPIWAQELPLGGYHADGTLALGVPIPHWSPPPAPQPDPAIAAFLASPDRLPEDKETYPARHYPEMIQFWGVRPGMQILDVFGAHAITTEVLSGVVGPRGRVFLQNPPWYYQRFTRKLVDAHLKGSRLPNVVEVESPFTRIPLPANSVDGVTLYLIFHDMFWMEPENVPAILGELSRIVKPGGFIGIADHAAPDGANVSMSCRGCKHRLEEKVVRRMFLQAGFVLEAESDALRNPLDDRTTTAFESPVFHGNTDRFLLRFRKPG
jgi:predicted methyltransferase